MAPAKSGTQVAAVVDEANGVVSIGVVHEGAFLPVASKSLDYAKAVGLNEGGSPDNSDDQEGGE